MHAVRYPDVGRMGMDSSFLLSMYIDAFFVSTVFLTLKIIFFLKLKVTHSLQILEFILSLSMVLMHSSVKFFTD